jgi:uncharacterized protein YprB with RNaseH-like and TPR domain
MNLADRLRGLVRPGGSVEGTTHVSPRPRASTDPADATPALDLLGGELRRWRGHPYCVIDRIYPPEHRHGRAAVADSVPGPDGCWPALALLEPAVRAGRRVLFFDVETTGLSGGAGTYAFLVGCGWFEGATFRVRQYLLAGYAAERGLLEAVRETAGEAGTLATYNGKTFDLPIIDTRCLLHRLATPFEGMPHVDMLHPARRLWPPARVLRSGEPRRGGPHERSAQPAPLGRVASRPDCGEGGGTRPPAAAAAAWRPTCRLAAVEAAVLGHVREGDIPAGEIPSRYFQYVRSGDPRPLGAVLEHNRLDLLSLAMLTARAAQLLEQGAAAAGTAREALGLGRLYQRGGMLTEARACFARAAGLDAGADAKVRPCTDDLLTRAEALRAYAVLCRRARQHDHAAEAWRRVLELPHAPLHLAREAREALAVHYEHRLRDFQGARQLAIESLQWSASIARTQAIRHRIARLDRKLDPAPPPLF